MARIQNFEHQSCTFIQWNFKMSQIHNVITFESKIYRVETVLIILFFFLKYYFSLNFWQKMDLLPEAADFSCLN